MADKKYGYEYPALLTIGRTQPTRSSAIVEMSPQEGDERDEHGEWKGGDFAVGGFVAVAREHGISGGKINGIWRKDKVGTAYMLRLVTWLPLPQKEWVEVELPSDAFGVNPCAEICIEFNNVCEFAKAD